MISQEVSQAISSVAEKNDRIENVKAEIAKYTGQKEAAEAQIAGWSKILADEHKELDRRLKILCDLTGSLQHFAPYHATVGALLEKMDSKQNPPDAIPQADGDSSAQLGREG